MEFSTALQVSLREAGSGLAPLWLPAASHWHCLFCLCSRPEWGHPPGSPEVSPAAQRCAQRGCETGGGTPRRPPLKTERSARPGTSDAKAGARPAGGLVTGADKATLGGLPWGQLLAELAGGRKVWPLRAVACLCRGSLCAVASPCRGLSMPWPVHVWPVRAVVPDCGARRRPHLHAHQQCRAPTAHTHATASLPVFYGGVRLGVRRRFIVDLTCVS